MICFYFNYFFKYDVAAEFKQEYQSADPHPEDMLNDFFEEHVNDHFETSNSTSQSIAKPKVRQNDSGRSANTGPKGVKEDYEEAKLKMRARRLEEKLSAERAINKMAVGNERFVIPAVKV